MAGKKGIIPTHVKKKEFSHPNIHNPIIQILQKIYLIRYTIVRICRERKERGDAKCEVSYYITSLSPEAEKIANVARCHWGLDNKLHWRLDVIFRQDNSRYRDRIGARNLAIVRKMALNALVKDNSIKGGVATKQCAAACNPAYREQVL